MKYVLTILCLFLFYNCEKEKKSFEIKATKEFIYVTNGGKVLDSAIFLDKNIYSAGQYPYLISRGEKLRPYINNNWQLRSCVIKDSILSDLVYLEKIRHSNDIKTLENYLCKYLNLKFSDLQNDSIYYFVKNLIVNTQTAPYYPSTILLQSQKGWENIRVKCDSILNLSHEGFYKIPADTSSGYAKSLLNRYNCEVKMQIETLNLVETMHDDRYLFTLAIVNVKDISDLFFKVKILKDKSGKIILEKELLNPWTYHFTGLHLD